MTEQSRIHGGTLNSKRATRVGTWLAPRLHLTASQRGLLAEKCADFGNIAAGSLIFGTLIREEALTLLSIVLGIILLIVAYVLSVVLSRQSSP